MNLTHTVKIIILAIIFTSTSFAQSSNDDLDTSFLNWTQKNATSIGESFLQKGRVGGFFDTRVFDTNSSYNYKLRATLMSPEAIRAAARIEQLRNNLTNEETLKLVEEAEKEDIVILVEIDPREGSGIIPNDWRAFIKPKNSTNDFSIRGTVKNELRNLKALQSVKKRDYDYDIFWVSFSLKDENNKSSWQSIPDDLELIVGIKDKQGKVDWKLTNQHKTRIEKILNLNSEI